MWNKQWLAGLLCSLTAMFSLIAVAEEPQPDKQQAGDKFKEVAVGQEINSDQNEPDKHRLELNESKNPGVIFAPTEELSEDLSVPFPVDI